MGLIVGTAGSVLHSGGRFCPKTAPTAGLFMMVRDCYRWHTPNTSCESPRRWSSAWAPRFDSGRVRRARRPARHRSLGHLGNGLIC